MDLDLGPREVHAAGWRRRAALTTPGSVTIRLVISVYTQTSSSAWAVVHDEASGREFWQGQVPPYSTARNVLRAAGVDYL